MLLSVVNTFMAEVFIIYKPVHWFVQNSIPKQERLKFSEYSRQYKIRKNHFFRCCIDVAATLLHKRRFTDVFKTSYFRRFQDVVNWTPSGRRKPDLLKMSQIRRLQDIVNWTSSRRRKSDVPTSSRRRICMYLYIYTYLLSMSYSKIYTE